MDNREFDDGLLQKISDISFEDDVKDIPSPPDVSNYLVSEVGHGLLLPLSLSFDLFFFQVNINATCGCCAPESLHLQFYTISLYL